MKKILKNITKMMSSKMTVRMKGNAKKRLIHGMTIAMNAAGMGMITVLMKMANWYATVLLVRLATMRRNELNGFILKYFPG